MGHFVYALKFERYEEGVVISTMGRSKRGTTFLINSETVSNAGLDRAARLLLEEKAVEKLMAPETDVSPS